MLVEFRPSLRRILRPVSWRLALTFVVALLASIVNENTHELKIFALPELPLSLVGATLGVVIGFRTNSAYQRWWEARILWGRLVNESRSWARQILSFTEIGENASADELANFRKTMVYTESAYVHALRCHLRREPPPPELRQLIADRELLDSLDQSRNVPLTILQFMAARLAEARAMKMISDFRFVALDRTLTALTDIQGGCERINNTPFPRQYDYYPELFIYGYCFFLPLTIADTLGFLTPLITVLVGLVLFVVNEIGKNLEDPFASRVYGTPLSSLSRMIEINLRQMLGETELPDFLTPIEGVLY